MRSLFALLVLLLAACGNAQFVFPKKEYHAHDPSVYTEDPFIVKYREEFFAVFKGDFERFRKAYALMDEMVKKDPKDARAMVWLGNGHTVQAGLLQSQGKAEEAKKLLGLSREAINRAVELKPDDPNIYMMRAVTLYIQGQFWPDEEIPRSNWETLRDDCLRFIEFIGPERWPKMSVHVQGETYGELGIAYMKLGEKQKAIEAFKKIIELVPGTAYEERAKKEIAKLG